MISQTKGTIMTTDSPNAHNDAKQHWDNRYSRGPGWGIRVNEVFQEIAETLPIGRALEIGAGRGGDALWLAERGWEILATDISQVAVDSINEAASIKKAASLRAEQLDLETDMPDGEYDLVYACYFHSMAPLNRLTILRRAARRVARGGRLVTVDHASVAPWSCKQDAVFPTIDEAWTGLQLGEDWTAERLQALTRVAAGPGGQTATVVENVIVARRK